MHLAQTTRPACAAIYRELQDYFPHSEPKDEDDETPIPFEGDFFGDPDSYAEHDFGVEMPEDGDGSGMDWDGTRESDDEMMDFVQALESEEGEGNQDPEEVRGFSDDDEVSGDEDDAEDYEGGWELPVAEPQQGPADIDDEAEGNDDGAPPPAHRQGLENVFQREPVVVPFPDVQAGKIIGDEESSYRKYENGMGNSDANVYAPFASKREWEIAKWAKLRGPGSTALTDLLKIEGVSAFTVAIFTEINLGFSSQVCENLGLTFKTAAELNKVIDTQLPSGRPRFRREEIVVGGEAFDVYFRDILECIRALYGDPEFAPYLKFVPERHYTDENRTVRLYHDMHTGKWWWDTQVREKAANDSAVLTQLLMLILD